MSADSSPERVGRELPNTDTVHRVKLLPDDRRYLGIGGNEGLVESRIKELWARPKAPGDVVSGDETVRLSAAKRGLETQDRILGTREGLVGKTTEKTGEKPLHPTRRVGKGKEARRVAVVGVGSRIRYYLLQACGEVNCGYGPGPDFFSRDARFL